MWQCEMMMKDLEIKIIRPDVRQFVINELPLLVLLLVGILGCGLEEIPFSNMLKTGCLLLALYLVFSCLFLLRCRFTITGEQLIYERGVFARKSDFIELYRVVDFKETRSLLQQLAGLKTVVVYSGDRTHPHLAIPGIYHRMPLVEIIRERVEYNKQRKGVYEITNR